MSTKFTIDEDEHIDMDKRLTDFDELNQPRFKTVTKLWRLLALLVMVICMLCLTSIIICATNNQCRNHIPTVSNMLNSTLVAPFITGGLYGTLGLHLVIASGFYYMLHQQHPYWSYLQLFFADTIYLSVIITMLVYPFTGWQMNWAIVTILVTVALWMLIVLLSLIRYYQRRTSAKQRLVKFNGILCLLYIVCSIIYIVLRGIPDLGIIPRDDGILVVEIIGGLSFFLFMILCVIHIGGLEIQIRNP